MSEFAFFDTNILVYTDDLADRKKQEAAVRLLNSYQRISRVAVSLQVLQEYFNTLTRKLRVDPKFAQDKIELLSQERVVCFKAADVIASIELHRLQQISFWDAMIVHAARLSGASVLYTEDLQHGSTMAGVRIVNPFL